MALIADLNCKEARYDRNAVLGPDTTEEGPCPKGTRQSATSRIETTTSKQTTLWAITDQIMRSEIRTVKILQPV